MNAHENAQSVGNQQDGMDDHTTTKLDAFRSLVQKAGALHTELATLDGPGCRRVR